MIDLRVFGFLFLCLNDSWMVETSILLFGFEADDPKGRFGFGSKLT